MIKKLSKGDLKILKEACKKFRETYASPEEMRKYCGEEAEQLKKRASNTRM